MSKRSEVVAARVTASTRRLIRHAAEVRSTTVSRFVATVARAEALNALLEPSKEEASRTGTDEEAQGGT